MRAGVALVSKGNGNALPLTDPHLFALCLGIGLVAGFVKGMVGFAMPLVLISGLSSIIPPELALAGLLFPTLLGNLWQGGGKGSMQPSNHSANSRCS
ncbi:hypothetical protein U5922_002225 [Aquicoccus sp. G2-2]|uniref:hypothetical protein n=1 Tax=Aquicoccus sp. G2-2 TaxID=3092120 RepID=UPI002AE03F81|nr:hypothetical protein [Aquicoccus sp. G2-2]MEA1112341.1 hypothetical protein [Aquicoccus sp. G2-2]